MRYLDVVIHGTEKTYANVYRGSYKRKKAK